MLPRLPSRDAEPTDHAALARRLAAGDAAALESLLGEHWDSVARYAARALHDRDAAHDVCQEAFIRLWQARESFVHAPELVRPFLYRAARNLVLDELRKRTVRARAAVMDLGFNNNIPGPAERFDATAMRNAIEAAIDRLPPRRRDAFVLAYLHDLSYKEAADVMGISAATVKNQIAAALAQLRELLAPQRNP